MLQKNALQTLYAIDVRISHQCGDEDGRLRFFHQGCNTCSHDLNAVLSDLAKRTSIGHVFSRPHCTFANLAPASYHMTNHLHHRIGAFGFPVSRLANPRQAPPQSHTTTINPKRGPTLLTESPTIRGPNAAMVKARTLLPRVSREQMNRKATPRRHDQVYA